MEDYSRQLTLILLLSNFILCTAFSIHFLIKFRATTNRFFLFSWIAFWVSLSLLYLIALPRYSISDYSFIGWILLNLINILNPIFLCISSEYFTPNENNTKYKWSKWLVFLIALIPICFYSISAGINLSNFLVSYLNFLAMAIYSGRYLRTIGRKGEWIAIILYIYSSVNIIFPLISLNPFSNFNFYLLVLSIVLPLKIILYLSGYIYLNKFSLQTQVEDRDIIKEKIKVPDRVKDMGIPEPTVGVSLTGLWALLYVMWKYPSGKFVVFVILLSLLSALIFIISNLSILKDLIQTISK